MKLFKKKEPITITFNVVQLICANCGRILAHSGMNIRDIETLPLCNCIKPKVNFSYLKRNHIVE